MVFLPRVEIFKDKHPVMIQVELRYFCMFIIIAHRHFLFAISLQPLHIHHFFMYGKYQHPPPPLHWWLFSIAGEFSHMYLCSPRVGSRVPYRTQIKDDHIKRKDVSICTYTHILYLTYKGTCIPNISKNHKMWRILNFECELVIYTSQ